MAILLISQRGNQTESYLGSAADVWRNLWNIFILSSQAATFGVWEDEIERERERGRWMKSYAKTVKKTGKRQMKECIRWRVSVKLSEGGRDAGGVSKGPLFKPSRVAVWGSEPESIGPWGPWEGELNAYSAELYLQGSLPSTFSFFLSLIISR